jgi:hypothetical protein
MILDADVVQAKPLDPLRVERQSWISAAAIAVCNPPRWRT